jgi:hypothetical protein
MLRAPSRIFALAASGGGHVACSDEAREILALKGPNKVPF